MITGVLTRLNSEYPLLPSETFFRNISWETETGINVVVSFIKPVFV